MYKKILVSLFFLALLIVPGSNISAQSFDTMNIYFFWGEECPHCAKEKLFLQQLEKKYPAVRIYDYEVWHDVDNRDLMIETGKKLQADVSGVPLTVIGDQYTIGYYNEATTGTEIERAVEKCLANQCVDVVGSLAGIADPELDNNSSAENPDSTMMPTVNHENPIVARDNQKQTARIANGDKNEKIIDLPFLGEIDALNFSLPILTIVMGALDGFNPCAMWALLFLISLLLGMQDRRKMWILGSAFIVASASVYFVFMSAWLNLILFIGLVVWVRVIIGLIALIGGGYNLKEYFTTSAATCKVTSSEKRQRVFEKLKEITQQRSFILALGGIILLALAVNLVELVCSAGLPAVYTQVLALSDLAQWQYYLYILLYIFVFMLDDLLVFFVAMTTLQMTGITAKYSRWSHLIGGILMLVIGLLLIFKPGWLMFG